MAWIGGQQRHGDFLSRVKCETLPVIYSSRELAKFGHSQEAGGAVSASAKRSFW
jgi:hypothetical protein